VFFCQVPCRSGCGPWLYWLVQRHFRHSQVITAPPTAVRGMPRFAPLLARAAGMASQERAAIDKVTEGLWRVLLGDATVYIQLSGQRAHAVGARVASELELASAYNASKDPPWDGNINMAGLALWAFVALRAACAP